MSNSTNRPPDSASEWTTLPGHAMGYIDSQTACTELVDSLRREGFSLDSVLTFQGDEGIDLLTLMLKDSQWGESAERALKQGMEELLAGHSVFCVKVDGDEEAATVARISTQYGGRSVTHFGAFVDTRLS